MNREKYNEWKYLDTRSLTLHMCYKDWEHFKKVSNIKDNKINKRFFETLLYLYGNVQTRENSLDYLTEILRFQIESANELYEHVEEVWNDYDKLLGSYNEANLFAIGELTEEQIKNTGGYDNRKIGRQTVLEQNDVYKKLKNIISGKTVFNTLLNDIIKVVFREHQIGYSRIRKGFKYE